MDFIDIFNTYSLSDIVIFLMVAASMIMGAGRFLEWVAAQFKKLFDKEYKAETKEMLLDNRLQGLEKRVAEVEDANTKSLDALDFFSEKLEILIESDKDNIKAYLTDKHHLYVYDKGWIDDYALDCCERRYVHYKKSGGNSFVDHLMEELRALPVHSPQIKGQ